MLKSPAEIEILLKYFVAKFGMALFGNKTLIVKHSEIIRLVIDLTHTFVIIAFRKHCT